jgi:hypothetical protein
MGSYRAFFWRSVLEMFYLLILQLCIPSYYHLCINSMNLSKPKIKSRVNGWYQAFDLNESS